MSDFNPNDIGVANGNYFGLPCNEEESDIVLLSVPWDATVSYGALDFKFKNNRNKN